MVLSLISATLSFACSIQPTALRCESVTNPVGVWTAKPRLSWKLKATSNGKDLWQKSYRILVASSPNLLAEGKADLWDSGETPSGETFGIAYAGKPLSSRSACWWKVEVTDQQGAKSGWTPAASWTVGLQAPSEWQADWIGFDEPRKRMSSSDPFAGAFWIWDAPKSKTVKAVRTVSVSKELEKATLDITVDDHFTVSVNGKAIVRGEEVTDSWRNPKQLDLTKEFKSGENLIEIEGRDTGGDAGILAKLNLHFKDGSKESISTDSSWTIAGAAAKQVAAYGASPWGSPGKGLSLIPIRYLRKEFEVAKRVRRATLRGTALGIANFHLNGKKVSDEYFMPGWTSYEKRVYARSYDVTKHLRSGKNALGVVLADGWFSGYVGYGGNRDHYGKNIRASAQLEVEFEDGSLGIIATGPDWKASTGPILFSDFLMGESFDARRQIDGWDQPAYSETGWKSVDVGTDFKTTIEPWIGQPVREVAEFRAKTIKQVAPDTYVLDLGQNIAGFARLKSRGSTGQRVTLRFAERLNPDGTMYVTNLRGAKATDDYVFRGEGLETWSPSFTFHGFQYIEVSGLGHKPGADEVKGIAVTSETPLAGTMETSDPMINKLVSNALWTQRMNFIDIPTDCPQRDERLGWTGDAQAYIRTACMLTDVQPFFHKWLITLEDSQRADGQFPMVAPVKVAGDDGGPAWADAGVICPWTVYQVYGDKELLARHYPSMKKFVDFCKNRSTASLLPPKQFHAFGDWVNINDPTPNEVIYTAYFAGSARIVSQAARELGFLADVAKYEKLYMDVRKAFQTEYVSADTKVRGDSQCAYVLALAFDLLDDRQTKMAANHLVAKIEKNGGHLSTGFVGTRDIMNVLSKVGRNDVAFKLLHNKTFPSWGFTIANGATSIWERWDGWTPEKGFQDPGMNSFAHYAFGAVVGWIFDQVGGIGNAEPGFKTAHISPQFDPNLKWSKCTYDSVRGPITCEWKRAGKGIDVRVVVPPNMKANISLPRSVIMVGSGEHRFQVPQQ